MDWDDDELRARMKKSGLATWSGQSPGNNKSEGPYYSVLDGSPITRDVYLRAGRIAEPDSSTSLTQAIEILKKKSVAMDEAGQWDSALTLYSDLVGKMILYQKKAKLSGAVTKEMNASISAYLQRAEEIKNVLHSKKHKFSVTTEELANIPADLQSKLIEAVEADTFRVYMEVLEDMMKYRTSLCASDTIIDTHARNIDRIIECCMKRAEELKHFLPPPSAPTAPGSDGFGDCLPVAHAFPVTPVVIVDTHQPQDK